MQTILIVWEYYILIMFGSLPQKWVRFNCSEFWLLQIAYYLVQEINKKKRNISALIIYNQRFTYHTIATLQCVGKNTFITNCSNFLSFLFIIILSPVYYYGLNSEIFLVNCRSFSSYGIALIAKCNYLIFISCSCPLLNLFLPL